jgi:GDP-fucose protein O-fucosyltransferase
MSCCTVTTVSRLGLCPILTSLVARAMCSFIRDHVRYTDEIQCAAARVVAAVRKHAREKDPAGNPNGLYDAFHVRRGDFQYKATRVDADVLLSMAQRQIPDGATLYMATDERDKSFFSPLKEHYDLVFLDDFHDEALVGINTNFYGATIAILRLSTFDCDFHSQCCALCDRYDRSVGGHKESNLFWLLVLHVRRWFHQRFHLFSARRMLADDTLLVCPTADLQATSIGFEVITPMKSSFLDTRMAFTIAGSTPCLTGTIICNNTIQSSNLTMHASFQRAGDSLTQLLKRNENGHLLATLKGLLSV